MQFQPLPVLEPLEALRARERPLRLVDVIFVAQHVGVHAEPQVTESTSVFFHPVVHHSLVISKSLHVLECLSAAIAKKIALIVEVHVSNVTLKSASPLRLISAQLTLVHVVVASTFVLKQVAHGSGSEVAHVALVSAVAVRSGSTSDPLCGRRHLKW